MSNKFQTSVADVVLRDITTGQAIAHGKTNITTSLKQTMAKTEARGGIGNPLLYTFFHDRAVEFTIEMPVFNEYILALQSGATIGSGNYSVVATDCLVLSSGSGFLAHTPTGDVTFIFDDNDAAVLVTPSGSAITVTGGLNRKGVAIYDYLTTADQITVTGIEQPTKVSLTLTARVYANDKSTVVQYFQVNVPSFQVDGAYTLNMAANAISNQSLNGMALLHEADSCSSDPYFYTATYINVDSTTSPYTIIAATPSPMSFSVASGSATQSISVLGYRGVLNTTSNITSLCTYSKTSGCPCFNINASTGVVSASGSTMVVNYNATMKIAYWDVSSGSLTDTVSVVAVA
jgi:hypothetical protein